MSSWTYINGNITADPLGRTQAEKRYILETVLNHLPRVTGSEGDMDVYIVQKNGWNNSSSHDEFGERTNNLIDRYGHKSFNRGSLRTQDEYILVVNAALRDREFDQTYREFMKWLVRLCKRVMCEDILIEIKGYDKSTVIKDRTVQNKAYSWKSVFYGLFEDPSWCNDTGEPNWTEFMMFEKAKDSNYPMMLAYKYFDDEENDKEVERRKAWRRRESTNER